MGSKNNPNGRKNKIVEQKPKYELLIDDSTTNEDYCLNEKTALVWNWCDGTKSVSEISRQLSKRLKAPVTEAFILNIKGIKQR